MVYSCLQLHTVITTQAAELDALFYKPSSEPAQSDREAGGAAAEVLAAAEAPNGAGALPDLPLWRVQWATLPGTQVFALTACYCTSVHARSNMQVDRMETSALARHAPLSNAALCTQNLQYVVI